MFESDMIPTIKIIEIQVTQKTRLDYSSRFRGTHLFTLRCKRKNVLSIGSNFEWKSGVLKWSVAFLLQRTRFETDF